MNENHPQYENFQEGIKACKVIYESSNFILAERLAGRLKNQGESLEEEYFIKGFQNQVDCYDQSIMDEAYMIEAELDSPNSYDFQLNVENRIKLLQMKESRHEHI